MKLVLKISFITIILFIMYFRYQRILHVKARLYVTDIRDEYFQGDVMRFKVGVENLSDYNKEFIVQTNILNELFPETRFFIDAKSSKFVSFLHKISTTCPRGDVIINLYSKRRDFPNLTKERNYFLDAYKKTVNIKIKKVEKPVRIEIKKPPPLLAAKLELKLPHLVNYNQIVPLEYTIMKLSETSGDIKLNLFCEEDLIYSTTIYLNSETISAHYNYLPTTKQPKTYIIKGEVINYKTGELLSSANNYFSLQDLPPILVYKSVEYIGKDMYRFAIKLKDDLGINDVSLYLKNDKKSLLERKQFFLSHGDKKMGEWQCMAICKRPKMYSYKIHVTDNMGRTIETDFTKLPIKK